MPERPVGRDLLAVADALLDPPEAGGAGRRRAASTAYYAAFHALASLCADTLVPGTPLDSAIYLRVYRALDHGPLKVVFDQAPLRDDPKLRDIGKAVSTLQSARIAADYLPLSADPVPPQRATELVRQARQLLEDLDALSPDDRRLLAVCLLFRTREAQARS